MKGFVSLLAVSSLGQIDDNLLVPLSFRSAANYPIKKKKQQNYIMLFIITIYFSKKALHGHKDCQKHSFPAAVRRWCILNMTVTPSGHSHEQPELKNEQWL